MIAKAAEKMKVRFLGTGTSTGVPEVGCRCEVCTSDDLRDKRLRCSVQVEVDGKNLIIDCSPDFRQQMLKVHFRKIDAILITHEHYDHIGGIEDLRSYGRFGAVDLFAEGNVNDALKKRLSYLFREQKYRGIPNIRISTIPGLNPFMAAGIEVVPIRVMHHRLPILGFRINGFAYLTDVKTLPDTELKKLAGLDMLVLSALRHEKHISHQTLEEAIALAEKIDAKQTFFTHMSHQIGLHEEVDKTLPNGYKLAYDGLEVDF